MRVIFIRHGQSTGNAGVPCHDLGAIELTELGHEQAREVAASWTQAPALIVTSPYTRTLQTAAPTIARFRDLVERFEPDVHQFVPVNMYESKKDEIPFDKFYWFVVCSLIDSLDREHTTLTYEGNYDAFLDDGFRKGQWYFDVSAIPKQRPVYSLSTIGDRHLWRDPYYNRDYVKCSDSFGNAMMDADLTGFGLRHYEEV